MAYPDERGDRHYLAHRLAVAGYTGDAVFAPAAARRIYRASRGVPRLINILANKAMMLAYGEGVRKVTGGHALVASIDTPRVVRAVARLARGFALACAAFSSIGWIMLR